MTPERLAELRAQEKSMADTDIIWEGHSPYFDEPFTWGELRTLLDYYYADSPDLDATDGAHPAWWRGEEYGVLSAVRAVNKWLDGESLSGAYREPLQMLRTRIVDLVEKGRS